MNEIHMNLIRKKRGNTSNKLVINGKSITTITIQMTLLHIADRLADFVINMGLYLLLNKYTANSILTHRCINPIQLHIPVQSRYQKQILVVYYIYLNDTSGDFDNIIHNLIC